MTALYCLLLVPCFAAISMAFVGHSRFAGMLNAGFSVVTFIIALFLGYDFWQRGEIFAADLQLHVDALSMLFILLIAFVGMTTAFFSNHYMWHNFEHKIISARRLRFYHVMYQTFVLMMLLAVAVNNTGVMWVAMEGSTLATVLLVASYRTPQAIEAAWKYFILCIVGIALALFGTMLVYFSAAHLALPNGAAIFWSVLHTNAKSLDPNIMKLAFVFLFVGYGTKVGLVPLHNWLPDAHSESPAPMSTLLSGLLLNVALYALLRFKVLADISLGTNLTSHLFIFFGALSFIVAAILLNRQRNIKRLFSYSSIEHMGLITFTFGIGGALATFAALFYILMHSLAKAAVFMSVGNVGQIFGTHDLDGIKGCIYRKPWIGWGLLLATVAVAGLPPFGIFSSEVLLFVATMQNAPWLCLLLVSGFLIAVSGLLRNIQPAVYGANMPTCEGGYTMIPVYVHLALLLFLGVYLPPFLQQLLAQATTIVDVLK